SSSRPRPSFVAHRRPEAPDISAEPTCPVMAPEGKSLFVNLILAVTPSGAWPASESCNASASGFGGGVDPLPPLAATAIAAPPAARATTATISIRRREVESVRRSFKAILSRTVAPPFYVRTLRDL